MPGPVTRARKLISDWTRRPTAALAESIREFHGRHVLDVPLALRSQLCVAMGEAAEAEERFEEAQALYASAVAAADPGSDERTYAGAALRVLLNAERRGDRTVPAGVAKLLAGTASTPRLTCLEAAARGLAAADAVKSRRAFEAAMGAAWESGDADAEALAHYLLSRVWLRLGKVARAAEHAGAARDAARRSKSTLLERRMAIEDIAFRLAAGPSAGAVAEARALVTDLRRRGFAALEALAWSKVSGAVKVNGRAKDAGLVKELGALAKLISRR
jgi:tetratricopeptide (TPR) repeat protein